MPVFEDFARLASDLTLDQIIEARRRGKLKIPKHTIEPGGFQNSEEIVERLRALREALTQGTKPKPPVTHMKRSVLLKRVTEFSARLDRIIHGEKSEAGSRKPEVREFAVLPAIAGGIIGSGVGARTTGKKLNPITGKWEDADGNPTSAPTVSSAVGAAAGAGAGIGASKLHGAVMQNYGGAGGAGQAYRNLTRNVATQAGEKVSNIIGPTATTAIQDVHGIAKAEAGMAAENIAKKFKALRGAGTAALKKVFAERNMPRALVEFEARIDAIIFESKKKAGGREVNAQRPTPNAQRPIIEFAQRDDEPKKKSILKPVAITAGLGAGTIVAARAAGPVRDMAGGALRRLRERFGRPNFQMVGAPYGPSVVRGAVSGGASIPPEKVHEFLLGLHKASRAAKK